MACVVLRGHYFRRVHVLLGMVYGLVCNFQAGLIEEMMEDTFESLEDDDLEEQADQEVEKILWEVTSGKGNIPKIMFLCGLVLLCCPISSSASAWECDLAVCLVCITFLLDL